MHHQSAVSGSALLAQHEVLDGVSAAGCSVAADEGGGHFGVTFGGLELARHSGEEAVEDKVGFDADDGVVGAGHADIGDVGCALREDAGVGGGDVGVGAEDGSDASVKIPAESDLFAGGFGMDVEDDEFGLECVEDLVGFAERVVAGRHEDAALKVDDGVGLASREFSFVDAESGSADGVVGGTEDAPATLVGVGGDGHVFEDLFFVPDMVAGGDDVGAHVEDFFGDGGCEAEASGGVFAVDDKEFNGVGFEDVRQMFAYDVAAGGAKNVADKKNVHKKDAITRDTRVRMLW